MKMPGAERFSVSQDLNGLEPVCLSLSIVAVEDVSAAGPMNTPRQVAKAFNLNGFEKHREILS